MKKTSIYLDADQDLRLNEAAVRRGTSRTQVIRDAIATLLEAETDAPRRPRPLGASRHRDTSTQVDDLLRKGFGS